MANYNLQNNNLRNQSKINSSVSQNPQIAFNGCIEVLKKYSGTKVWKNCKEISLNEPIIILN